MRIAFLSLRTLRWLGILGPLAFLGAFDYARHFWWFGFLHAWPLGFLIVWGTFAGGVILFTNAMFTLIQRLEGEVLHRSEQLRTLNEAGRTLSSELSLEVVLQKVADSSRDLLQGRYAALAVLDEEGNTQQFLTSGLSPEEVVQLGAPPQNQGVLGLLTAQSRALRLADVTKYPLAVGFPPHHPPMRSFLGVPLVARGKLLGRLYLAEKQGAKEFTVQDEEAATLFAAQAAVAIENARLYQQAQRLAVLEERDRISRDLHDGIIQSAYAIGLNLEDCLEQVEAAPAEVKERLDRTIDDLNEMIKDVRSYIMGLRPQALRGKGLEEGLAELVEELKGNTPVAAELTALPGDQVRLTAEQIGHLFHIAREALSNVAKHARASLVRVNLSPRADTLVLTIVDNGVGFDPQSRGDGRGQGLPNMEERARLLGGRLEVSSEPGRGTTIQVAVPLPQEEGNGR